MPANGSRAIACRPQTLTGIEIAESGERHQKVPGSKPDRRQEGDTHLRGHAGDAADGQGPKVAGRVALAGLAEGLESERERERRDEERKRGGGGGEGERGDDSEIEEEEEEGLT